MKELSEKDQLMRAYWLGVLDYEQIETVETDWFASDQDTEQLEIVRADLIDDYLAKNLTSAEQSYFEINFLPHNLEDIVLEKSSLEISREKIAASKRKNFIENFLGGFRGFFGFRQIAAASALVLICFGLWFIFSGRNASEEIVRNNEQVFTSPNEIRPDSKKPDEFKGNIETGGEKAEDKNLNAGITKVPAESRSGVSNRNSAIVKKQPAENRNVEKPMILFLTVFRGTTKTVSLTGDRESLILKLTMPGIDKAYKNYRLKIYDANGNAIVRRDLGGKLSLKKSGDVLTMPPLKSALFKKNNNYRTFLVGVNENGEESELISYDSFKIK